MSEKLSPEEIQAQEDEAIEKLIHGQPVTVYHDLKEQGHFKGVQQKGIQGGFVKEVDRQLYFLAHFTFSPINLRGNTIQLPLNQTEAEQLKIYDGRTKKIDHVSLRDLIREGYDGVVRRGGMFLTPEQRYTLVLFDGKSLAGKFEEYTPES